MEDREAMSEPSTQSECPLYEYICDTLKAKAAKYAMDSMRIYLGPKDWKYLFGEVPELIHILVDGNRAVKMLKVSNSLVEIEIDWTLRGGEIWIHQRGSGEDVASGRQMANAERNVGREGGERVWHRPSPR
jgi:hypothetical protein